MSAHIDVLNVRACITANCTISGRSLDRSHACIAFVIPLLRPHRAPPAVFFNQTSQRLHFPENQLRPLVHSLESYFRRAFALCRSHLCSEGRPTLLTAPAAGARLMPLAAARRLQLACAQVAGARFSHPAVHVLQATRN
jgi:hypothetical protein